MTQPETPLPPEAMGLVAQLVQQNYDDYAATTQRLLEGLQDENLKLTAELHLIRTNMSAILSGAFMPTSGYLSGLLWPSREEILDQVEQIKKVVN